MYRRAGKKEEEEEGETRSVLVFVGTENLLTVDQQQRHVSHTIITSLDQHGSLHTRNRASDVRVNTGEQRLFAVTSLANGSPSGLERERERRTTAGINRKYLSSPSFSLHCTRSEVVQNET